MDIRHAIRELRRTLDISQEQLGKRLGKRLNSVHLWEAGRTKPTPASLANLYRVANEAKRSDLASIFLTGNAIIIDSEAGNLVREALPMLKDFFIDASLKLTQVVANPNISNEQRGKLIGSALEIIMDGHQFVDHLLKEIQDQFVDHLLKEIKAKAFG